MCSRPAALGVARFADVDDAPLVMKFVNDSISNNFRINGVSDIVNLIENCVFAIVQLNIEGTLVGFLAAKEYPLIPSVHPAAWEGYMWTKYKLIEMNARNSLFVHLLCWNKVYSRELVDLMLKSVFMHDPHLQYIGIVKSFIKFPLLMPGQARAEASFRRVQAIERGMSGDQLPAVYVAERREVSPRLRVRRAVEEDNDDIVPIIERHSARLRQLYGDYYISELISRHPESDRVLLVCEHKEVAVGVMCLNTQINYGSLEECFELSPFAGLRHPDAAVKYTQSTEPVTMVSDTCMTAAGAAATESSSYFLETMSGALARDPKTRIRTCPEDELKDVPNKRGSNSSAPAAVWDSLAAGVGAGAGQCAHAAVLDLLDQDEEELEFDIVNIDPALYKMPVLQDPTGDNYNKNIIDGRRKEFEKTSDDFTKYKKEKKRSTLTGLAKPPEVLRYTGAPNAFLLELFAMHPDYDERYGFDMLEVAYELFPDREYCVVCLPSSHTSFPLLEHFTLVTPHCTRMRFINETLYVAHINSVRGEVRVRCGQASDLVALADVVEHAPRREDLAGIFETSLRSTSLDSYVLLSQDQPVGVLVVGPLEDGTSLRTQYELEPEPRRPGGDCTVLAGVVSPVIEPHSRWMMREVLRQSRYSTLLWMCQPIARGDASPNKNMMSLAERMAPVRPRLALPNISGNKDLDKIFQDLATPFSLWVLERPLTFLPKIYVNNGIVVVGASRTGLSFLEALIMGPSSKYLTFTNITLVSESGLPAVAECLRAADTCVPRRGRYTGRYLKSVPFCFYIDVMSAVMVHIDRKRKCIHLKGGGVKFYDQLVITCGQQFQHPDYMKIALEIDKEISKGKPCDRMLMDNPKYLPDRVPPLPDLPENVMFINSLYQANMNFRKLLRMVSEDKTALCPENPIVVYGQCVEAYTCIAGLLEMGVSPADITFVEPFPPEDHHAMRINCFNDETIDERVQLSVVSLGIRVVRRCQFVEWRTRGARVVTLRLMSPLHQMELPCFALFYYGLRALDLNAFRAINESGLVYDGGLVVGPAGETNDPHIHGAGACATYSRRLRARRGLHDHYYSEDIGDSLAQIFLRKLDPLICAHPEFGACPPDMFPTFSHTLLAGSIAGLQTGSRVSLSHGSRRWQPVMKYLSPLVVHVTLPGPLYYLKVRKPGPDVPMEVQLYLPHQGHCLTTDKRGNYFRLRLDALHRVAAVTCLAREPFPGEILSQLYGKHEAFFNKLLCRFQLKQIDDLFEYFTQTWMAALYQDTFSDLLNNINEQDVGTIYDLVKSRFSLFGDPGADLVSMRASTCSDIPDCGYGPKEAHNLGTFRNIVERHIGDSKVEVSPSGIHKAQDIPSECGQSAEVRGEAAGFWEAVGGERLVVAHVGAHLARHALTNPHYATPCPPPRPSPRPSPRACQYNNDTL